MFRNSAFAAAVVVLAVCFLKFAAGQPSSLPCGPGTYQIPYCCTPGFMSFSEGHAEQNINLAACGNHVVPTCSGACTPPIPVAGVPPVNTKNGSCSEDPQFESGEASCADFEESFEYLLVPNNASCQEDLMPAIDDDVPMANSNESASEQKTYYTTASRAWQVGNACHCVPVVADPADHPILALQPNAVQTLTFCTCDGDNCDGSGSVL